MAVSKINPDADVVNGAATVLNGRRPSVYDRGQHLADASGIMSADDRYLSGPWSVDRSTDPADATDTAEAGSGSDAVVLLPARDGRRYVLFGVAFSYETEPVDGSLVVESPSGVQVFGAAVTSSGPGFVPFEHGLRGARGGDVRVVLTDGGANKTVSLLGRRTE